MLTQFKKNDALKAGLLSITFVVMTLSHSVSLADECGVLRYQSRHSGVVKPPNKCPNPDDLALGDVLALKESGRVWLENQDKSLQMVCMNYSNSSVKFKVMHTISPWIEPINLPACDKAPELVTCKKSNEIVLKCWITGRPKIREEDSSISLINASINLRSVDTTEKPIINSAYVEPDIDLCRKIFDIKDSFTVNGMVKSKHAGEVIIAKIVPNNLNPQFISCVQEALNNGYLPFIENDTPLKMNF